MHYITDINQSDPKAITLLIDCSIQAYNAFSKENSAHCDRDNVQAPEGFELVDAWSGVDEVFGEDKTVETYGLVFRSIAPPWDYIFAFRGTDSLLDALDDLGAERQQFYTFNKEPLKDVEVASGFYDIYKTSDGELPAMRQQLFKLLDKIQSSAKPIAKLFITGHSLGAALSELFSLDLAICRPTIKSQLINFASPRVGNRAYVNCYEQYLAGSSLRVRNTHDAVPHLPPADLGFEHTQSVYLIAFYSTELLGKLDVLANHSSIHYQAVLECAKQSEGGVCITQHLQVDKEKAALRSEQAGAID